MLRPTAAFASGTAVAVTVTFSLTPAARSDTFNSAARPSGTLALRRSGVKPLMANWTSYSPGGRRPIAKSPVIPDVVDRDPCSAGDVTVTETPGTGRAWASTMVPRITPVCTPWATAGAAHDDTSTKTTA